MLLNRIERLWRRVSGNPGWIHCAVGVPAFVGITGCIVVWGVCQTMTRWDVSKDYYRAAMHALEQGDMESAERWLRKVTYLNKNDPAARFRLAKIALEKQEHQRARRLLAELAPVDRVGFGPAHLFVASQMLNAANMADRKSEAVVRWHLSAALAKNPSDSHARHMLAEFELMHRSLQDAIAHYRVLEPSDPSVNRLLAQLHVAVDNRTRAKLAADRGLRRFSKRIEKNHGDIDAKVEMARLYSFLEIYDEATKILNRAVAYQRVPIDQLNRLRTVLADIYVKWDVAVGKQSPEHIDERLHLLKMAIKFAPEDHRAYQALAHIRQTDDRVASRVDAMFDALLSETPKKSLMHVNLAIAAAGLGQWEQEREQLRKSLQVDPNLAIAANNLAWNLANRPTRHMDEAMHWIDKAIELAPQRYEFLATRGRILGLAGRTREAIAELEKAAKKLPERHDINETLATLYQKIGDDAAAGQHTARAASLEKFGRL